MKTCREFEFKDVPAGYQICFNAECPMREACLRWKAGQKVTAEKKWGPAIYPTALEADGTCQYFHKMEPKRMAWGFDQLFYNVLARDDKSLRTDLKKYLGGKTPYYRYHRGDKLLTPEQQAWIIRRFESAGYTKDLEFDGYVTTYDFHHR